MSAPNAWAQVKAALVSVLGVSIESPADVDGGDPFAQSIRRVFTKPPPSIEPGDLPCVVLGESTLDDEWDSGGADEQYLLTCSLLLKDEDVGRAVELVEAYREAIKNRLRLIPKLKLGPGLVTGGLTFTAVADLNWASQVFAGFQFTIPIYVNVPVEFGTGFEED